MTSQLSFSELFFRPPDPKSDFFTQIKQLTLVGSSHFHGRRTTENDTSLSLAQMARYFLTDCLFY